MSAASMANLRDMLECETVAGRKHLAGLAISHATGMSEEAARHMCDRIAYLRLEHRYRDIDVLRSLNPPGRQLLG